jgi:hypothetical protein
VQTPIANELDGNDDDDQIDDMITDIGMQYDLRSRDQHPSMEVQNFYRLLAVSDIKVHDSTDLTYCRW